MRSEIIGMYWVKIFNFHYVYHGMYGIIIAMCIIVIISNKNKEVCFHGIL